MTNELSGYGDGAYIDEFLGAGPKNYAYRVTNGDGQSIVGETLKVRGITLNFLNCQTVNFDLMKEMTLDFADPTKDNITKTITEKRIARDNDRQVLTKFVKKDYRVVYSKRALFYTYCTLPYGY
jgi:hypothetical protein